MDSILHSELSKFQFGNTFIFKIVPSIFVPFTDDRVRFS